jgi:hypothetical protein
VAGNGRRGVAAGGATNGFEAGRASTASATLAPETITARRLGRKRSWAIPEEWGHASEIKVIFCDQERAQMHSSDEAAQFCDEAL